MLQLQAVSGPGTGTACPAVPEPVANPAGVHRPRESVALLFQTVTSHPGGQSCVQTSSVGCWRPKELKYGTHTYIYILWPGSTSAFPQSPGV